MMVTFEFSRKTRYTQGFTLIEVSVGIVIMTLVMTGLLRGNTLIASAQTKRLHADISAVTAAY